MCCQEYNNCGYGRAACYGDDQTNWIFWIIIIIIAIYFFRNIY